MSIRILIIAPQFSEFSTDPASIDAYNICQDFFDNYDCIEVDVCSYSCEKEIVCGSKYIHNIHLSDSSMILSEMSRNYLNKYYKSAKVIRRLCYKIKILKYEHSVEKAPRRSVFLDISIPEIYKEKRFEKYDVIISFSLPVLSNELAYALFKKRLAKKWIIYMLDPCTDCKTPQFRSMQKAIKIENKWFKKCTKIFTTEEIYNNSEKSLIKDYKNKVEFVPAHLISFGEKRKIYSASCNNSIKLTYLGQFYQDIRNPLKLVQYLKELPSNIKTDMYSRGCENILNCINCNNLQVHDYVTGTALSDIYSETDVFLSLGNTESIYMPSKIITYIGQGKPIIHFVQCSDDPVVKKYGNYPLICFIPYNDDYKKNSYTILNFCRKMNGRQLNSGEIKKLYPDHTVDSVVNKIFVTINKDGGID